ncbi:MAG: class I SAM-dependent methyltransferase [Nitrospirae bacterium]|nr:MAG: class I SAM-dependent methyltransferase [Nitrospirota bacterium]
MEPWKQAEMAFENTMAGTYDFHYYRSPISKAHLREFFNLVRRYAVPDRFVLDVGGGTGAVTERLLRRGYRRIVTVDLSLAMLREAKKKMPELTAIVCDGEHLPFKDDSFRTVICSSVLHHLPFPDRMLGEIKRALAPYGVVVAQEPNQSHCLSKPRFSQVSGVAMGLMHYLYRIEQYEPVSEPPIHEYHRAFTRDELVSLFSAQMFILDFRSRFAFSCLFTKLHSPMMSRMILAVDRLLRRNEGSVFHIVCSKSEGGHRTLLKNYLRFLEQLRQDPDQRMPGAFLVILPALIVLGRFYEFYERVRQKLGKSVY